MSKKVIKVIELFAGVGGFRLGLEKCNTKQKNNFEIVWANQWEPSTSEQHAFNLYKKRFKNDKNASNVDISKVSAKDIPLHDMLVGGFPCQDYSVARTLNSADGLIGKKGVLWWQIYRIIKEKGTKAPSYLLLENVDRLLKSPAKQRGRDFAIMLASLSDLGYILEWRVINAADYGMPQRRRRVFILGYKQGTDIYKKIKALEHPAYWVLEEGVIAKAFPVKEGKKDKPIFSEFLKIDGDLGSVSDDFAGDENKGPFENAGIMIDRKVFTIKTTPQYKGKHICLGDILLNEKEIPEEFFINKNDLKKWEYLKGAKKEPRESSSGHVYNYSEGPMVFPDALDRPSRTIITGEGGSAPSRFKHVVRTKSGRLRRLVPVELERLNMFSDNHTKAEGITDIKRAFFMGNALVVGIVEGLAYQLVENIKLASD